MRLHGPSSRQPARSSSSASALQGAMPAGRLQDQGLVTGCGAATAAALCYSLSLRDVRPERPRDEAAEQRQRSNLPQQRVRRMLDKDRPCPRRQRRIGSCYSCGSSAVGARQESYYAVAGCGGSRRRHRRIYIHIHIHCHQRVCLPCLRRSKAAKRAAVVRC